MHSKNTGTHSKQIHTAPRETNTTYLTSFTYGMHDMHIDRIVTTKCNGNSGHSGSLVKISVLTLCRCFTTIKVLWYLVQLKTLSIVNGIENQLSLPNCGVYNEKINKISR